MNSQELRLHGYYRSSTSFRVRIALNLKGLYYAQVPVNLKDGEQSQDAYLQVNPYGTVPALETPQGTLFQSLAILDWLEATYPEPSFCPQELPHLQNCREIYYAVATEIHAVNNLPVLKYLRREFSADQGVLETWYAEWIHRTFGPIEKRLGDFEWMSNELPFGKPTLFEIVLIPQIYNAWRWNTDLSSFPNLRRIDEHCQSLEAFQRAHPDNQPDTQ